MANEYALSYPRVAERGLLPVLSFIGLLLLIYVGLDAFSPPPEVTQYGGVPEASHGDVLRQTCYLSVAVLIGMMALQRYGLDAIRILPFSMLVLLAWCVASALWAPESTIVLRRAGLEVVVVVSLFLSVEILGAERAFLIWRWLLAAILLVNFLSIPFIAAARHGASEIDPGLVGDWRGLYGHKNMAGAVSALTALVFLFTRNGQRNWIGVSAALASCVFLAMTHSKSSAGFLIIAGVCGLLYRLAWRDGLNRAILVLCGAILAGGLAIFALLNAAAIARALEDPAEFTGRGEIWAAELRYIADHPLLGAGFGTFTDTKAQSPLHNYVSGSWVDAVSHGHNGYLQVLVTIGGIGFVLAMLALVAAPMRRLWALDLRGDGFKPMLMAIFVFAVAHNFMESDFLEGDGVTWCAMLLVIAALSAMARGNRNLNETLSRNG
jgi:exopolysaccharide production protein ExoQ